MRKLVTDVLAITLHFLLHDRSVIYQKEASLLQQVVTDLSCFLELEMKRRVRTVINEIQVGYIYQDEEREFWCSPIDWEVYQAKAAIVLDGDTTEVAVNRLIDAVRAQYSEELQS